MAHYIKISNFGPIEHCELDVEQLTVLTGPQASGKSTIAKAIYFFRAIKDDILDLMTGQSSLDNLLDLLNAKLNRKFKSLFGANNTFDIGMSIEYFYEKDKAEAFIKVYAIDSKDVLGKGASNFFKSGLRIEYGVDIISALSNIDYADVPLGKEKRELIECKLEKVFRDELKVFFIPAGRSTIASLADDIAAMFISMDDWKLDNINHSTYEFVKFILKTRQWFSKVEHESSIIQQLSDKVLGAVYLYRNNEELFAFPDKLNNSKYVKISSSSSGQQEAVWIFNVLSYFYMEGQKVFLIVEEPEAHLYPESQMHIADALAIFANTSNSLMITTHSPYILGELNSLILGGQVSQTQKVVVNEARIKPGALNAFYVKDGTCNNAIDESGLIMNELIDGAADEINERCGKLLKLIVAEEES